GAAVVLELAVAVRAGADRARQRSAVLTHDLRCVAVDENELCRARSLKLRLAGLEQRADVVGGDGEAGLRLPDREAAAGILLAPVRGAAERRPVLLDLAVAVGAGAQRLGRGDRQALLLGVVQAGALP